MPDTYLANLHTGELIAVSCWLVGAVLRQPENSADLEPILPSDSHIRQCADTAVQASSAEVAP
ncbi:hypothetical protein [Pseudomonas aeruginosa]|uniref:hypothetical protein n=1 Tax=Pseudomonas aeruginosa TaxID=287 RepID=UPI0037489B5D